MSRKKSPLTLAQKIIRSHLVDGSPDPGHEVGIRIDQTLTQDATGTMVALQFEALGLDRVKTELSVSYVDHNTLQVGFENPDDHRFLQTSAARFGVVFSRPGNGICHQLHLERFGVPGKTLLGSDSHTTTGGGLGMLAIGAGGLDVAIAMAGEPFYFTMPRICGIRLTGRLTGWATAKDVIHEILRRLSVKGGRGLIMEYVGPGVDKLTVPERATIANQGTELGALTSLFPSDLKTQEFLTRQGREGLFRPLEADSGACYDQVLEINLSEIEPLIAMPSSPDAVKPAQELAGTPVDQVCIGSCTNSSYTELATVARILKGKKIHPRVSLTISPGSRQVMRMLSEDGSLEAILQSGARVLECTCGPCIGMGGSPGSDWVSLRSFNRNFPGRSGTKGDKVYLVSNVLCAASALAGEIVDPAQLPRLSRVAEPKVYRVDDEHFIFPKKPARARQVEISRGPNIKPLPSLSPLAEDLSSTVVIQVGDNITTDAIMPAGAKILPLRSNLPAISEYVFNSIDPGFPQKARAVPHAVIVGGHNYGQGSSREHAAMAPRFLGVAVVIAKSYARIHKANLINFGILPLSLVNESDYERLSPGTEMSIQGVRGSVKAGLEYLEARLPDGTISLRMELGPRDREILLAGGSLNHASARAK